MERVLRLHCKPQEPRLRLGVRQPPGAFVTDAGGPGAKLRLSLIALLGKSGRGLPHSTTLRDHARARTALASWSAPAPWRFRDGRRRTRGETSAQPHRALGEKR